MKFLILLFVLLMSFACTPQSEEMNITRLEGSQIAPTELTQQIQSLVDTAGVTGLAVAILNEGEVVYQQAFGYANVDSQRPLTLHDNFYAASFSKAVFGYLVAQLVQEGAPGFRSTLTNLPRSTPS